MRRGKKWVTYEDGHRSGKRGENGEEKRIERKIEPERMIEGEEVFVP
jgi:hypothetical protein